jgi:hypothetical protein
LLDDARLASLDSLLDEALLDARLASLDSLLDDARLASLDSLLDEALLDVWLASLDLRLDDVLLDGRLDSLEARLEVLDPLLDLISFGSVDLLALEFAELNADEIEFPAGMWMAGRSGKLAGLFCGAPFNPMRRVVKSVKMV